MPAQLRAILVDVVSYMVPRSDAEERLRELEELTLTYGGIKVVAALQRRTHPDHRTFIGKGKLEELQKLAPEKGANVLIVNNQLRSQQVYNLEEAFRPLGVQVWDRVDLILHIFDRHAVSAEAKLQIELARLRHLKTRIYNLGEQLGQRGRGGTGTRGGSGEGNTEIMKRHVKERERTIVDKLKTHESTRALQRAQRSRAGLKTVALVGYTNAGKTSLLNALTKRKEYAASALFATLDTRVGESFLGEGRGSVLISDTIGFIRELPPELIAAFRSTLSEAVHADILLHVVDAADPRREEKIEVVSSILAELGLAEREQILVWNKADLLSAADQTTLSGGVIVSAQKREGIDRLKDVIAQRILSPVA